MIVSRPASLTCRATSGITSRPGKIAGTAPGTRYCPSSVITAVGAKRNRFCGGIACQVVMRSQ